MSFSTAFAAMLSLRQPMATLLPTEAKRRAISAPMPREPPVISTIFPQSGCPLVLIVLTLSMRARANGALSAIRSRLTRLLRGCGVRRLLQSYRQRPEFAFAKRQDRLRDALDRRAARRRRRTAQVL